MKEEKLKLPGNMTDLRYLTESMKFLNGRITELKNQRKEVNMAISSAEESKKHISSILNKIKKSGG